MNVGLKDYLKAAFHARPAGMFVPPNWVGLGIFGLLGVLNPGFWLLGAGLEMGYLYVLITNPRFQRLVRGKRLRGAQEESQARVDAQVVGLDAADKRLYRNLEQRCQAILETQGESDASAAIQSQREGLGRLLYIYLRLLLTRQAIYKVIQAGGGPSSGTQSLEDRSKVLEEQLKDASLPEDLRRSLASQREILQQRLQSHREARTKLDVLTAELTRIEEQVELIREQAALAADPSAVSQRIDQIGATLGGTTQWIREQQQIYGKVGDLLETPPPIPGRTPVKEGS